MFITQDTPLALDATRICEAVNRTHDGGHVVAIRPHPINPDEWVVLCLFPSAVQPWVTWRVSAECLEAGPEPWTSYDTYWGHYHSDYATALKDFLNR